MVPFWVHTGQGGKRLKLRSSGSSNTPYRSPRWRWIGDYEGRYLVSDEGQVARILKPRLKRGRHGAHARVGLGSGRTRRDAYVHRLVLAAFVGPCPAGMEACHGDDDGLNNHLGNLRWDTPSANRLDAWRTGRARGIRPTGRRITGSRRRCRCGHQYSQHRPRCSSCGCSRSWPIKMNTRNHRRGEAHPGAVLTASNVAGIRIRLLAGEGVRVIAREYGVAHATISRLKKISAWSTNEGSL